MTAARLIRRSDDEYPSLLREVEAGPERLWFVGRPPKSLPPCVAIVGARRPTPYGVEVGRMLASELAVAGFCVVSGMARGVDQAAHEGALTAPGGVTMAVLGTGVDVAYPPSADDLYRRIAERGTLLSQFPPGTAGFKSNFRLRNWTIAGVSLGVVVVQGVHGQSGALITANAAVHLNRAVFAVPGDIRAPLSSGPHALIADGARICRSARDVVEELHAEIGRLEPPEEEEIPAGLTPEEACVLEALAEEPARVESVASRARLDAGAAARALVRLEIKGLAERRAGGVFCKVRRLAALIEEARTHVHDREMPPPTHQKQQ